MAKDENKEAIATPNEAAGLTRKYYTEAAEKSKKLIAGGKAEGLTISLTNRTLVRFTRDFGKHIAEGDEMEVSDVAYAIYEKAGVIEKL